MKRQRDSSTNLKKDFLIFGQKTLLLYHKPLCLRTKKRVFEIIENEIEGFLNKLSLIFLSQD